MISNKEIIQDLNEAKTILRILMDREEENSLEKKAILECMSVFQRSIEAIELNTTIIIFQTNHIEWLRGKLTEERNNNDR